MNCHPGECMNDDDMKYISVDTATIMLEGFSRKFFMIQEINFGINSYSIVYIFIHL